MPKYLPPLLIYFFNGKSSFDELKKLATESQEPTPGKITRLKSIKSFSDSTIEYCKSRILSHLLMEPKLEILVSIIPIIISYLIENFGIQKFPTFVNNSLLTCLSITS